MKERIAENGKCINKWLILLIDYIKNTKIYYHKFQIIKNKYVDLMNIQVSINVSNILSNGGWIKSPAHITASISRGHRAERLLKTPGELKGFKWFTVKCN
jgi:hypothetical protein